MTPNEVAALVFAILFAIASAFLTSILDLRKMRNPGRSASLSA
jgi:hypothetical protein